VQAERDDADVRVGPPCGHGGIVIVPAGAAQCAVERPCRAGSALPSACKCFAALIRDFPPAIVRSSMTATSLVRYNLRGSAKRVASPDVTRRQFSR
jgi:hypothetical protein